MAQSDPNARLNQIVTLWSVVRLAHHGPEQAAHDARRALLERYGGAVKRYLLGALRDPEAADELNQEFAFRFLHGDLRGADRERGRFRDFVKGVLFHLVADHHKKKRREPGTLPTDYPEPAVECSLAAEREEAFRTSWRDELLARTWAALQVHERDHGQPHYTVLRFRADHPDVPSAQMAERLTGLLGKEMTAAGARKALERARDRFADLLLDEIAQGIDDASVERLEEELAELELLEHCRPALDRRREGGV
jgi:RNA polymerase sigma-70 factor (ECF subfamily)